MILCYRCKHFIGQELYGEIHCRILGRIPSPMVRCIHFEPRDKKDLPNTTNTTHIYGRPISTGGEFVE